MNKTPKDDDRGFLYGDGLFETVRVQEGVPLFVDRHAARLERSGEALDFPDHAVEAGLDALDELHDRDDGLWRVTVTRPGDDVFGGGSGTVALRHRPLPAPPEEDGLAVKVVRNSYFPANRLAEHKTTSWIRSVDAVRRARAEEFDDALLVSPDGRVGEAATANVFVRIGGGWVTPPVEGILPGVIREVLLERAEEKGTPIEQRPLFVGDLQTCESVALTSAGRLATAVEAVDNNPVSTAPVEELQGLLELS